MMIRIKVFKTRPYRMDVGKRGCLQPLNLVVLGETTRFFSISSFLTEGVIVRTRLKIDLERLNFTLVFFTVFLIENKGGWARDAPDFLAS